LLALKRLLNIKYFFIVPFFLLFINNCFAQTVTHPCKLIKLSPSTVVNNIYIPKPVATVGKLMNSATFSINVKTTIGGSTFTSPHLPTDCLGLTLNLCQQAI
jgi:hypothetical protein